MSIENKMSYWLKSNTVQVYKYVMYWSCSFALQSHGLAQLFKNSVTLKLMWPISSVTSDSCVQPTTKQLVYGYYVRLSGCIDFNNFALQRMAPPSLLRIASRWSLCDPLVLLYPTPVSNLQRSSLSMEVRHAFRRYWIQ